MCNRCDNNGYIKEMLPQGIPFRDKAVRLKICPDCAGVNSNFEKALAPVGITVKEYFQKRIKCV